MGNIKELVASGVKQKSKTSVVLKTGLSNVNAWILTLTYGMCFGIELTMNSVVAGYFHAYHGLTVELAGLIGGLYGLMNLFARSWGGLLSDYANKRFGMRGRLWAMWIVQTIEGVMCMVMASITLGMDSPFGQPKTQAFAEMTLYNDYGYGNKTWVPVPEMTVNKCGCRYDGPPLRRRAVRLASRARHRVRHGRRRRQPRRRDRALVVLQGRRHPQGRRVPPARRDGRRPHRHHVLHLLPRARRHARAGQGPRLLRPADHQAALRLPRRRLDGLLQDVVWLGSWRQGVDHHRRRQGRVASVSLLSRRRHLPWPTQATASPRSARAPPSLLPALEPGWSADLYHLRLELRAPHTHTHYR